LLLVGTLFTLVAAYLVFYAATYLAAGIFINIYIVFWVGMWPWEVISFLGNSGLDVIAAVEMLTLHAAAAGVSIFFMGLVVLPAAWQALKTKIRNWVQTTSLESSVEPARELYRSWKDKYCSKIEIVD
jgi:hypothetical protein